MIIGRTERLVLEPLSSRHADGLFAAMRHETVDTYLPAPEVTSLDSLRERIARLSLNPAPPGEVWLNFVMKRGAEIIGRIEATSSVAWAEIAYLVGPSHQRQGFGREAVRWLVDRLHASGCEDVWATVHPMNARSASLLEKLGFVPCHEMRRPLQSFAAGDLVFEHRA